VVAQDKTRRLAKIVHEARLLVVAERYSLVAMVRERRERDGRGLREREEPVFLGRHGDACIRVQVKHASRVRTRGVNRAVNYETCRFTGHSLGTSLSPFLSIFTRLLAVISSKSMP